MQSIISESNNFRGSSFFLNYSKFYVDSRNGENNSQKMFLFWDNGIWIVWLKLAFTEREYLSFCVDLLTNSLRISNTTEIDFLELIYFKSDQKFGKIVPCRFKQSFGPFNILTVHKCSDTWRFWHLSYPAFCTLWYQKQITLEDHLFVQSISNVM